MTHSTPRPEEDALQRFERVIDRVGMVAQARYYREKLNVDPDDPAGKRAVVEAYIQVLQISSLAITYMGRGKP